MAELGLSYASHAVLLALQQPGSLETRAAWRQAGRHGHEAPRRLLGLCIGLSSLRLDRTRGCVAGVASGPGTHHWTAVGLDSAELLLPLASPLSSFQQIPC